MGQKKPIFLNITVLFGALCLVLCSRTSRAASPADYEGYGIVTQGAKDDPDGWEVYHVTTLDDSEMYQKGTLCYALLRTAGQTKGQYIVFDVAGTIKLGTNYRLKTQHSYTTIDGSSAPYPGITFDTCIRDSNGVPYSSLDFSIEPTDQGGSAGPAHDIIVNNIRFIGPGDGFSKDILGINATDERVYNVIFDHCTIDAAGDGIFDIGGDVNDVTVSWNLITGTVNASAVSGDAGKVQRLSMHHNIWAKNSERQPKIKSHSTYVDLVNNVCYGWSWLEGSGKGLQLEPHDSWETDTLYRVGVRRKYGDNVYVCIVEHTSDEDGPPHEEPDTNTTDWEVTDIVPDEIPSINIIGNVYHWVEDQGVDYWGLKRTNSKNELCVGLIYFEDNVFPDIEDEDYNTSTKLVIPEEYQVTMYNADTLGDTVVPYAGTHYPTQEEQDLLRDISLAIGGQGAVNQQSWQPPIGIPRPSFGIEETYRMYDDPANRNPALTYTQNAEGGYYTHYVDNTHPDATNSGNTYGTASKPRTGLPSPDLPPGSVVEIHGGAYTYTSSFLIKGYGTSALPIFVRGADSNGNTPRFNGFLHPEGAYLIVEGLSAEGCFVMGENGGDRDSSFVSVRYNDIYPPDQKSGGSIAVIGEYSASGTERADDVVIYNNTVHDFGDLETLEDDDWGGINVGYFTRNVWIVDNEIYGSVGGGVQINSGDHDQPIRAERIYVGRNHIHHMRAAGLWVKYGNDIVFSQNLVHDIYSKPSWTEAGKGMGYQYHPTSVWYIFNEVYNCVRGFHGTTGTHDDIPVYAYLIGNLFHSYKEPEKEEWKSMNWSGISSSGRSSTYIMGNTIHSYPCGMRIQDLDEFIIMNNIIMDVHESKEHIWLEAEVAPYTVLKNNLFYQSGGPVVINWGGPIFNDMDELRAQTSTGGGCIVGDPLFADTSANDFHLQSTSPAIDAGTSSGVVQEVFDLYQSTFGIDIRKDIEGGVRPYGGEWDIGAYEWGSTPADPNQEHEPEPEPDTDTEPEAVIPDATGLMVMNNIIKSGGNQSALIRCDMKEAGKLTVRIYDAKGKEIITICDEQRQAGRHEFSWAGQDSAGSSVGSGIYIVHCKAGEYKATKKVAIVK